MEHFKPPGPLHFDGNLSENWRRWKQRYELYLTASGAGKDDPQKVAILLHTIGDEGIEIFNTFNFEEGERTKLESVLAKFDAYCNPRKNTIMERYAFWERSQKEGETIDQFLTELKNRARYCEFGDQREMMIRDRIVFGIREARLKERLLRDSADPNLERVVELCRASELSSKQIKEISAAKTPISVNAITNHNKHKHHKPQQKAQSTVRPQVQKMSQQSFSCRNCGRTHGPRQCTAYGKTCMNCLKKNHFAKMCRGGQHDSRSVPKKVHTVNENDDSLGMHSLFIGELHIGQLSSGSSWFERLQLEGSDSPIAFKLDTGAEANVLPLKRYNELENKPKVSKTSTKLTAYGGQQLKPVGTVSTNIKGTKVDFFVVNVDSPAILGLRACQDLNLIQRLNVDTVSKETSLTSESLVNKYKDVFTGLGRFAGEYRIEVDKTVKPVVHPPRKVPFSLQSKLKATLDKLEHQDIIAVVDEPTEWVNSIVIVEKKDGSLRLCLDPKDLNLAIKREHFKIPTPEDISAELHGKKVFSILDEKDGYWQIQLDRESSLLCTFNTPFGRYRFKRLPFGISSASEIFQKRNQQIFGDIEGINMIADDMIIAAETTREHDVIVRKVMERAREQNVKFNPTKIQFKVDTVHYMGQVITPDGIGPDQKKVKAIVNMPSPTDKQALQRLLGMITYLGKFIPNLSEITAPLRSLLKHDSEWVWDKNCEKALNDIKHALTNAPVLGFFDPSLPGPVTIQADASQSGIGACLMQESKPIAYASRSLTNAEVRYAQIEKELLAIVFACDKFNQYIYGRKVEVQSDHKPLTSIIKKPLSKAAPRLQRMLLKLQRYEIDILYVPGKYMYVADALSRAYLSDEANDKEFEEEMAVRVHSLVTSLPVSKTKLEQLQLETSKDEELQTLWEMVKNGWPEHKSEASTQARPYWCLRDEIHEAEGLLLYGERIIIPKVLRKEMLNLVHESHLGIEKCKSRARCNIYWPGMSADIEDFVSRCQTCNRYKNRQPKEPLIPHPVPERPWQALGMDLFEYGSKDYLVVVDYYSKYPEISALENKTAGNVILHLKSILARHGIPERIMSDNMPFNSREFKGFAKEWDIELITSSPTYAQSNGLSERMVQTIKKMLKKSQETNSDPYTALLEYRNTAISGMSYSPAQLLMSRALRSKIPAKSSTLLPEVPNDALEQLKVRQEKHKTHYDKCAKTLPILSPGDTVRIRAPSTWEPAVVQEKLSAPRSYVVLTPNGRSYRRNRKHLMSTTEAPPIMIGPEMDDVEPKMTSTPKTTHVASTNSTTEKVTIPTPITPSNSEVKRTSSGRIVREPSRFKDYV